MRIALTLLAAILFHAASVRSGSVRISPAKDNTLFEDPGGTLSNGSGPVFFAGNNSGSNTRRAVIAFDIAAAIPQGSFVDSVVLAVHVSNTPNEIVRQFTLHRILSAWGEGQSSASGGGGAQSTPGDATWIHTFYPNSFWVTPGGDIDPALSATAIIGNVGFYSWSGAGMTADVQQWLDSSATNHGWLIQGEEDEAATARRFDSRENDVAERRPVLRVWYTPPTTPVVPTTWGRIKSQFRNGTR